MHRKHWLERLPDAAGLPGEVLPGIPVVELAGDTRVLIEPHGPLLACGPQQVRVQVRYGEVCISGERLHLARMTREQLVITGQIGSVALHRRNV